jgi:hypothetical protein
LADRSQAGEQGGGGTGRRVNPAAGTIKLILPKKGGTARQKDEKPEDLVELLK